MGKIVWLASYPKSGNTWMRAFLHNLLADAARPFDINRLGELTGGDVEARLYEELAGQSATGLSPEQIAALRPAVQERLAAEAPGSRFVKTHSAMLNLAGIPAINLSVTAGAIYIVRDPRDVALSFAHHLGRPVDDVVELMARENAMSDSVPGMVADFLGSWSQHVLGWTARPSPGLHVVRYEDMLAEPQRSFGAVAAFLRLEARRERLERAIRHASFKVLAGQETRAGFREKSAAAERFFRSGRAGGWRDALTADQVARIEADHAVQMARFGYRPETG